MRRKVIKAHESGIGFATFVCELECGHLVRASGRGSTRQPPLTVFCRKCDEKNKNVK